ncbi:MAG: two-component system response regulator [Gammaproteobacteria bacterium]
MSQAENHNDILIAQQERFLLRVLTTGLAGANRRIVPITDGQEILRRIQVRPPRVLIVDTDLAPMGGEELCRRLQAEHPEREFLTCILTSSAEDEFGNYSEWFSNFRMMEKPVSVGVLQRHISEHLMDRAA